MTCPNCGTEMQGGFLSVRKIEAFKTREDLYWHKLYKRYYSENTSDLRRRLSWCKPEIVARKNISQSQHFQGEICRRCGLVVFNYRKHGYREPIIHE